MIKKLLIPCLIANIFFSCKNDKTVNLQITETNSDILIDGKKESEITQTKVLTLGTFHFKFPNLDIDKVKNDHQIDVFDSKYQKEIELIVDKLAKFKPTKIIIERQPKRQQLYDSLYTSYLNGKHKLNRSEEQQLGFRLAKQLGLSKLHCVDAWGTDYEYVKKVIDGNDAVAKGKFMNYFSNNPDSTLTSYRNEKLLFKTEGILAQLKKFNSSEYVKKGLGDYLIGIFKYETKEHKQFGPDFVTSWWFNRNLRIFRNIQRTKPKPEDRILVIYGAGHMNLLNIFFDASPEYKLLRINDYLN